MEYPGHLEGMLDRDQRTAKLRFYHSDTELQVPKNYIVMKDPPTPTSRHCCCPSRTRSCSSSSNSTNSSHLSYRNGFLLNTFQSVKNVLIVGACLSLVSFIPSASSAPAASRSRMMSPQKWINPCGLPEVSVMAENSEPSEISSEDLSKIANQASIALVEASRFKYSYANEIFKKEFDELHQDYKTQKLEWLANLILPKSLGEKIPDEHLKNLKVDDVLLDVYGFLQMVAVGLEQLVWDLEDSEGQFIDNFKTAEQQLRGVLCELQEIIVAHGIKMRPDITRDIMSEKDRRLDMTGRKNRDWIIYREYMNTLEYIKDAFNYLGETSNVPGR